MLEKYKTVYEGGEGEIVEKKSRFIATVRPVQTEEEALAFIEEMKKKYWDARHNCYVYSVGKNREYTRCSDDGEPSGTAGRPMLDDNTLLALGNNDQRPDYVWHEGTAFHLFNLQDGHEAVCEVPAADGSVIFTLKAARTGNTITVTGAGEAKNWTLCLRNVVKVNGLQDGSQAESEQGLVVKPQGNALTITL